MHFMPKFEQTLGTLFSELKLETSDPVAPASSVSVIGCKRNSYCCRKCTVYLKSVVTCYALML